MEQNQGGAGLISSQTIQSKKTALLSFKSTPINWFKEWSGLKRNTVRKEGNDERFAELRKFMSRKIISLEVKIVNTESGESFIREITDVTQIDDYYIISW